MPVALCERQIDFDGLALDLRCGHSGKRLFTPRDDRGVLCEIRLLARLAATLHISIALAAIGDAEHVVRLAGAPRPALAALKVAASLHLGGPEAVLAYLSRYTHRVAISNNRLISADAETVTFRWKDYRIKNSDRQKVMRLATGEFIRRFLIHVLPDGFHRIRHYGFLASAGRKTTIAKIRDSERKRPNRMIRQALRSSRSP
jgi:hypothetical protein